MPQLKGLERWNYVKERESAGLTQKQIATKLGLTHGTLRKWLSQNRSKYTIQVDPYNNINSLPQSVYEPINTFDGVFLAEKDQDFFDWLEEQFDLHNYWETIPYEFKDYLLELNTPIKAQPGMSTYMFNYNCVLMQYCLYNDKPAYGIDMTLASSEECS